VASFSAAGGANCAHSNPLVGFESHFEAGKREGKGRKGGKKVTERTGENTPRNKFLHGYSFELVHLIRTKNGVDTHYEQPTRDAVCLSQLYQMCVGNANLFTGDGPARPMFNKRSTSGRQAAHVMRRDGAPVTSACLATTRQLRYRRVENGSDQMF